ncbi:uncharacterized protein LOC143862271 [Tasmannia lanceolata]|uniref:uncharacterized protein LOC143862271 n=1 Tax=Tasmannia lanceolata TaxID=3420 RepID=UPI004062B241
MAFQIPTVVQNENLHIKTGKGASGAKLDNLKPEKKGHKIRKALADVSNTGKASLPRSSKASFLKEKSSARGSDSTKYVPRSYGLTNEGIQRCNEWAKEGIEHVYFTGNDQIALHEDLEEKYVRKEVEEIMFGLSGWTQMAYGQEKAVRGVGTLSKHFVKLDLEPEVLLPSTPSSFSTSDNELIDDLFFEEELHPPWVHSEYEPKLKEHEGDVPCL